MLVVYKIQNRRPETLDSQCVDSWNAEFQTGDLTSASVEFDKVDFLEYYDVDADPWQMNNLAKTAPKAELAPLKTKLRTWYSCAGSSCP